MNLQPACPVCNSSNYSLCLEVGKYRVMECRNCTLRFLFPLPSKDQVKEFYNESYFKSEVKKTRGYKNYQQLHDCLKKEACAKIKVIKRFTNGKKILDIGAGTGVFLDIAQKHGYKVYANDISPYAVKKLQENNFTCFPGPVENLKLPKEEFDIISGWDIIEHTPNLKELMTVTSSALKKGGFLFLSTPDTTRIDARLMGTAWYGYKKIPHHLVFFNRNSITRLLKDHGFSYIEIKPWGFVRSLNFLSEKMGEYSLIFNILNQLLKITRIGKLSFFLPFTDSIIIAQKVE